MAHCRVFPAENQNMTTTTKQRHRETFELLFGASAIILFGLALVIWPSFGYFIGDVGDALLEAVHNAFPLLPD